MENFNIVKKNVNCNRKNWSYAVTLLYCHLLILEAMHKLACPIKGQTGILYRSLLLKKKKSLLPSQSILEKKRHFKIEENEYFKVLFLLCPLNTLPLCSCSPDTNPLWPFNQELISLFFINEWVNWLMRNGNGFICKQPLICFQHALLLLRFPNTLNFKLNKEEGCVEFLGPF